MSEIGEILQQATEVLDAKGWCQDKLVNHNGSVCAYGAINTVVHGAPFKVDIEDLGTWMYNQDVINRVSAALYDHLPEDWKMEGESKRWYVVEYNNAPRTQVQDIKDLFAKTIADEGVAV